jgi:hypothetical protein
MRIAWRKRLTSRAAAVAAAVAAGAVLAACTSAAPTPGAGAGPGSPGAASRSGGVISLTSISTLRSLFNSDNGHPRLVLIFSPT